MTASPEFDAESEAINSVYGLTVLITSAHRRFLDQLDPGGHRAEELNAHFDEMGNRVGGGATVCCGWLPGTVSSGSTEGAA
ncbi:hypothetical protein ABZU25_05915 [Micromonospora sp. NPDC005215]|uniref:hypothetical protein n=1 Tax=Micromonospora sp. NPDC005215 TaxID=3157024 RepID=UPI0033AAF2DC